MSVLQKIIKYAAIAFGFFLIASIALGILNLLVVPEDLSEKKLEKLSLQEQAVTELEIELEGMELIVATGETLSAETNNDNISCTQNGGKLSLIEKSSWLKKTMNGTLYLTLPPSTVLEKAEIRTGAGRVELSALTVERLSFELGAGEVVIHSITVKKEADVEGGAGKLTIKSGIINNLDFEMGVGEVNLCADLLGKSEIECGVGELNLVLGKKEEYTLKASKGIGGIKIDGTSYDEGFTQGGGDNRLEISGGIGAININFAG